MSNSIGGSGSSGASAAAPAPAPTPSPTSSSPSSSSSPAQSPNNFQDGIQYANNGSPDGSTDGTVNGGASTPNTAGTPSAGNTPGSSSASGTASNPAPQHFQDEVNHIMASLEQALESHHMFTGSPSSPHGNGGQEGGGQNGGGGNNINYGPHSQGNSSNCGPHSKGNNINYGPQSHGNNFGGGSNSGYNPNSSSNGGANCQNSVPGTSSTPSGNSGSGNALTHIPGQHGPSTGSPNTYHTNAAAGKQQIISALDKAGATPQEKAEILAMGAQETNDFQSSERDHKKDGTSSANYSAFNLNGYELRKFGYQGNLNALNNQGNIGTAATTLLHGIRQNGLANVQDLTRGGQSGENQVNNPQYEQWRNGQNASAEKYLQGNHFTDNTRIAAPASYW